MTDYTPDEEASPLDRQIMILAQSLHNAGLEDDAHAVAAAAAYLRELPGMHVGDSLGSVYESLEGIASAAVSIMNVIKAAYPHQLNMGR